MDRKTATPANRPQATAEQRADVARVIDNMMRPLPEVLDAKHAQALELHDLVLEREERIHRDIRTEMLEATIENATLIIEGDGIQDGVLYLMREAHTMELRRRLGHELPVMHQARL